MFIILNFYKRICILITCLLWQCQSLAEDLLASHSTDLQQRAYELQAVTGLDSHAVMSIMPSDASCEDIEVIFFSFKKNSLFVRLLLMQSLLLLKEIGFIMQLLIYRHQFKIYLSLSFVKISRPVYIILGVNIYLPVKSVLDTRKLVPAHTYAAFISNSIMLTFTALYP